MTMRFTSVQSLSVVLLFCLNLNIGVQSALADNEIRLPDIGDSSGSIITPYEEKKLGDAFFRSIQNQININQDPEIQEYIQSLGQQLVTNSDNPSQPFFFFVVIDSVINAFAGPGGYIGVNSGLILLTSSESELASVMAHEVAHVTQRHIYRSFEAASRLSLPLAAATIAAILIGSQSAELGHAAIIAAQAGSTQYQINFTRDNEQEADRIGIQTLVRANFNPRSMPVFFEKLERQSRLHGQGPPEFLRTHPVTASRIADTRGRAESYTINKYTDSMAYQLAKAKLRVVGASSPKEAFEYFDAEVNKSKGSSKLISQYGLALALNATGDLVQSKTILEQLIQIHPQRQQQFLIALATTEMKAGKYSNGLKWLIQARQRYPDSQAVALEYAKALLKAGQYENARRLLNDFTAKHKPTRDIFAMLAESYEHLGNKAEAHRYLAEYYYLIGEIRSAIVQVKIAQKEATGNFYLTSILDQRLKELRVEIEEEKQR